jgi:hypothetical protein
MSKRLFAVLAVSLLAILAFTNGATASQGTFKYHPGSAFGQVAAKAALSTVSGCADGQVCLYRWTQFNQDGGMWTTTIPYINSQPNRCIDLNYKVYPNDQSVADNSGSIIVNTDAAVNNNPYAYWAFFDWPNCNGNGTYFRTPADNTTTFFNHLSYISNSYFVNTNSGSDMYHQVHSIRYFPNG